MGNKVIEYCLAITLILDGWSVYVSPEHMRTFFSIVGVLFLIVLWIINPKLKNKHIGLLFAIFFSSLLYFVLMPYHALSGIGLYSIALPLFIDYMIKCYMRGRQFHLLYKIENVIVVLSFISTALWVVGPTLGFLEPNFVIKGDWGSWADHDKINGYWGLLFLAQPEDGTFLGFDLWRNTSIFTEGPMYNLWLDLSICTELFLREKVNKFRFGILITALLTTFSSTGYIFLLIIVLFYWISDSSTLTRHNTIIRIGITILSFSAVSLFIKEILVMKSDTGSYLTRITNYALAYSEFVANPMFGVGYMMGPDYSFGYTNSFTDLLGQGGLYLFLISFFPFLYYILFVKRKLRSIQMNALCILFLYLAITTNFYSRLVFFFIPAVMYSYIYISKDNVYEKSRCVNSNV